MIRHIALLTLTILSLSACYPVFEETHHEQLTFDHVPASPPPSNFADAMCCYSCTV